MRRMTYLLLFIFLITGRAVADEGMWLPSLVQKLNINEMQQMGFRLSAEEIYSINNASLKDAIVALDRGSCTAELISIITVLTAKFKVIPVSNMIISRMDSGQ